MRIGRGGGEVSGRGETAEIAARLLAHYDAYARELPWRRDTDPYRVWVSEVMLQQTRVEAVVPYFERWMSRFPTLDALAEADLDDVLRAWEGLGYYARARNLHRAARVVRERYGGVLPEDPEALRSLPGVGEYTAGAIGSIVFGRREPAVDGNVRRVLSRLYDLPSPTPSVLRRLAAALVPADRPGDFNQALMEFGATVCTPRSPSCETCPLEALCLARRRGTVAERPLPPKRKPVPENDVGCAVIVARGGRVLLVRRPEDGLLGGMWEFPGAEVRTDESPAEAAARAAADMVGDDVDPGAPLATVTHEFTHRRTTYHAFRFRVEAPTPIPDGTVAAWATTDDLDAYAMPIAQRKIAGKGWG